ncbi:MAG: ABC transporter substrate-binding protein [Planctomycetes bacterium]|nr:ABC transporter substrate-binding protein [Planctomycetota bacterium]
MRIVSLVPSATEIIALLGAGHLLVARSHECDYPEELSNLPVLTAASFRGGSAGEIDARVAAAVSQGQSLYLLDTQRLRELRPDLIVTQSLCSVCSIDLPSVEATARSLESPARVVTLNPATFEDVLDDITRIGAALNLQARARETLIALRERFFRASDHVNGFAARERVVFLEWTDPPYAAGHWTAQLIERAGADHPLNPTTAMAGAGAGAGGQMAHRMAPPGRRVRPEDISAADPDAIIVCPCGLSLRAVEAEAATLSNQSWWKGLRAVKNGRVALVDGNQMFNRPGPRLVDAYEFLVGWLNGADALIPPGFPWKPLARG